MRTAEKRWVKPHDGMRICGAREAYWRRQRRQRKLQIWSSIVSTVVSVDKLLLELEIV
jgi:hypothetical protein